MADDHRLSIEELAILLYKTHYTGPQIEEAIQKALDWDPKHVAVWRVESDVSNPYNLNDLTDSRGYCIDYFINGPSTIFDTRPIYLYVFEFENIVNQFIVLSEAIYWRRLVNGKWTEWAVNDRILEGTTFGTPKDLRVKVNNFTMNDFRALMLKLHTDVGNKATLKVNYELPWPLYTLDGKPVKKGLKAGAYIYVLANVDQERWYLVGGSGVGGDFADFGVIFSNLTEVPPQEHKYYADTVVDAGGRGNIKLMMYNGIFLASIDNGLSYMSFDPLLGKELRKIVWAVDGQYKIPIDIKEYNFNNDELYVYRNGLLLCPEDDYEFIENNTKLELKSVCKLGDIIQLIVKVHAKMNIKFPSWQESLPEPEEPDPDSPDPDNPETPDPENPDPNPEPNPTPEP